MKKSDKATNLNAGTKPEPGRLQNCEGATNDAIRRHYGQFLFKGALATVQSDPVNPARPCYLPMTQQQGPLRLRANADASVADHEGLIRKILNDRRWKYRRVQLVEHLAERDPLEPHSTCATRILNTLTAGFKLSGPRGFTHPNTTEDGWFHTNWAELESLTGFSRSEVAAFLSDLERIGFVELRRESCLIDIRLCPARILDYLNLADRFLETDLEIKGIANIN